MLRATTRCLWHWDFRAHESTFCIYFFPLLILAIHLNQMESTFKTVVLTVVTRCGSFPSSLFCLTIETSRIPWDVICVIDQDLNTLCLNLRADLTASS